LAIRGRDGQAASRLPWGHTLQRGPETLDINLRENGKAWVLELSGELDSVSSAKASSMINQLREDIRRLVVDLTQLDFIDSTGLSVLLNLHRRLVRRGGRLSVACPPGPVRRVFEVTRLEDTLRLRASLPAAIESLGET
jgi:anti-sigma B factor antagonist